MSSGTGAIGVQGWVLSLGGLETNLWQASALEACHASQLPGAWHGNNQWSTSREKLSNKETRTPCRHLFVEFRTWEFWGWCFWQLPGTSALSLFTECQRRSLAAALCESYYCSIFVFIRELLLSDSQYCLNSNPVPSKLLYLITEPLLLNTLCGLTILLRGAWGIQEDASGTLSGRRAKCKLCFGKRVPIFPYFKIIICCLCHP